MENRTLIEKPKVLVLAGATAVGKTEYALALAAALDFEIVGCDSMQLYKYMDIGSAKPTKEEMATVPHHLVDCIDPKESFSAARYKELALEAIRDITTRGKVPLVTGGTGLYLNSIIYHMDFGPGERDEGYRKELQVYAEVRGAEALWQRLKEADEDSAKRIHPNNVKRVIRALEAAERGGRPLFDFNNVSKRNEDYDFLLIGLTRDREELYHRIDQRVDSLLERGLEAEIKGLMAKGFTSSDIAMKGIGYKELLDYFAGAYDREEAVRLIKRNTRHLAKRQMTWFKRYKDMVWYNLTGEKLESMGAQIQEQIKKWLDSGATSVDGHFSKACVKKHL